ncbi:hypothetical protein SNEBB_009300 [Seison nebaliae]|nr:hypothetical protein SNEBB_009300 [Seison nebaliae]
MVSFTCGNCNDTLKKSKVQNHVTFGQCKNAEISCIDCCQTFDLNTFVSHTQCISEQDKYGKNKKKVSLSQRKSPLFQSKSVENLLDGRSKIEQPKKTESVHSFKKETKSINFSKKEIEPIESSKKDSSKKESESMESSKKESELIDFSTKSTESSGKEVESIDSSEMETESIDSSKKEIESTDISKKEPQSTDLPKKENEFELPKENRKRKLDEPDTDIYVDYEETIEKYMKLYKFKELKLDKLTSNMITAWKKNKALSDFLVPSSTEMKNDILESLNENSEIKHDKNTDKILLK